MRPIAVLISGAGSTLLNLIKAGEDIRLVISSNPQAPGLRFAKEAGIPWLVVEKTTGEVFSQTIFDLCRRAGVRFVVMGGFLKHLLIPPDFEKRVLNIHPALLPAFGGKGMYGLKVHQAVIKAGVKVSGCTVHFVDNEFDHGPVVLQQEVPVLDHDTPESLQARVGEAERELYPQALRLICVSPG